MFLKILLIVLLVPIVALLGIRYTNILRRKHRRNQQKKSTAPSAAGKFAAKPAGKLPWITLAGGLVLLVILVIIIVPNSKQAEVPAETEPPVEAVTEPHIVTPPSVLHLYGDMTEMTSKKDVRSITADFIVDGKEVQANATIKVQGTSSLAYDKKNYTIEFFADAAHNDNFAVDVGWGAQSKYCLKANWIDKTHSRNLVTAKLAAEIQSRYGIMEQAPNSGLVDGFPVEVYINDSFHGIYTWNIPKEAWMFGMDEDNPNHIVMCGEDWSDAVLFKGEPDLTAWAVEVGPEDDETLAKFARLSDFIRNSSDRQFKSDFSSYMDLDSMLTYYILVDFAYMPDNCGKNMLIVTYDGEYWYPSLYDLDTSWGTHYKGDSLWDYVDSPVNFARNTLAARFETIFAKELKERYFELREEILTKEHVMDLFNEFESQIYPASFAREQRKWGDNIPGYDFSQIEEFLDINIPRLDEKYNNLA